jgi:hypothetical protein
MHPMAHISKEVLAGFVSNYSSEAYGAECALIVVAYLEFKFFEMPKSVIV